MKKIVLALTLAFAFSGSVFAQDAVFQSMDSVDEVKSVELAPVADQTGSVVTTTTGSIQETSFKKAITNLDDASAEIREQLINYNSQLSAAQAKQDQIKAEIKTLKSNVKLTQKKLKNIDKSKKYINSNMEEQK